MNGVVDQRARYLARQQPGFTRPNLFRMRRCYDAYRGRPKVSALPRQLPWTHNLIILSQSQHAVEREFYLRMTIRERWSTRELERQFRTAQQLLAAKLHEFYALNAPEPARAKPASPLAQRAKSLPKRAPRPVRKSGSRKSSKEGSRK